MEGSMKKPMMFTCLVLFSFSILFASDSPITAISYLIDSDLTGNYETIRSQAKDLGDNEKLSLYSQYENSPTLPFVVNFLVGGGIGSFIQGDAKGGYTALISDVLASGLYITGLASIYADGEVSSTGTMLMLLGAGVLLGSRIYECIRPFSYAKDYNKNLHSALQGKAEVYISPCITAVDKTLALGLVGRVSF
jgi:hypothetical protein